MSERKVELGKSQVIDDKDMNMNMNMNMDMDIAIIGIACRFPGANDYTQYWENLVQGKDSIREINRWDIEQHYSYQGGGDKVTSKWMGFLDKIDEFDNLFFNISPHEAMYMDPHQRLLLEETQHCIEDSGVSLATLQKNKTAVYVASMAFDSYTHYQSYNEIDAYSGTGTFPFMKANRLSYFFGLNGESTVIDCACASSLAAVHDAVKSFKTGENDYAIVAGINLYLSLFRYMLFTRNYMLSQDGKCKTFDVDANGFVGGEGVGVLLLQPYEKALKNNNIIYGVIKGSANNHGGKAPSVASPRIEAQKEVILNAYKIARISPETVTYVEAHGTGTSLGDPIEIEALTRVFNEYTADRHFCKIGSVKTNIGHLEVASGMAGLIKVLLMLQHKKIPPTLNIKNINPVIDLENSPFSIADSLVDWKEFSKNKTLRAGISAFGLGGSNSHIILEEYSGQNKISIKSNNADVVSYPFVLSAKSPESLKQMILQWGQFINTEKFETSSIQDICFTLMLGREMFSYRAGAMVQSKLEIVQFIQNSVFETKQNSQKDLGLIIGEINEFQGFSDVAEISKSNYELDLNGQLSIVLDLINTIVPDLKIKEIFYKSVWNKKILPLLSFIVIYAFVQSLFKAGIHISFISGLKNGLLVSLLLSGIVQWKEVIDLLFHQEKNISFSRPNIPFYDPWNKKMVLPYVFDQNYLIQLVNIELSENIYQYFINKTRTLINKQFTFKKYIEEWKAGLKQYELTIEMFIHDVEFSHDRPEIEKKNLLLMIIIVSSFYKLNRKWNLTEHMKFSDQKFYELLDLILDGVMSKENLIQILIKDQPDYYEIAKQLNSRQSLMKVNQNYKTLQDHSKSLNDLNLNEKWYHDCSKKQMEQQFSINGSDILYLSDNNDNPAWYQYQLLSKDKNSITNILIRLWKENHDIQWSKILSEEYHKIALPVYPFNRSSHWFPSLSVSEDLNCCLGTHDNYKPLYRHPLIQENKSTMEGQKYGSKISGQEYYVRDHEVGGKKILAGVAYLEMVRAAVKDAVGPEEEEEEIVLKRVVWMKALEVGEEGVRLSIALEEGERGEIEYEIYSERDGKEEVHSQGVVEIRERKVEEAVNIEEELKKGWEKEISGEECYRKFEEKGIKYGAGHRGLEKVYVRGEEALAKLREPKEAEGEELEINPGMADSAIQGVIGMMSGEEGAAVPFSAEEIEILGKSGKEMWARIKKGKGKYEIEMLSERGERKLRIRGLTLREMKGAKETGVMLIGREWREEEGKEGEREETERKVYVIGMGEKGKEIEEKLKERGIKAEAIDGEKGEGIGEEYEKIAKRLIRKIQEELKGNGGKRIIIQGVVFGEEGRRVLGGVSGILKTVEKEQGKVRCQLLEVENIEGIEEKLEKSAGSKEKVVRYTGGKRYVEEWKEIEGKEAKIPWKEGGVYLISGGGSGLGKMFAQEIGKKAKRAVLILAARSEIGKEEEEWMKEIEEKGAEVEYSRVDVSRREEVRELIGKIKAEHGRLDGIIHSAGVLRDSYVVNKTGKEIEEVLAPKVKGLVNLREAVEEAELEVENVILFSSITGVIGNAGQADHAAANGFMDKYSEEWGKERERKGKKGRILSVNWPLWKEGGSRLDRDSERLLKAQTGMEAMGTEEGIEALYRAIGTGRGQVIVIEGEKEKIREKLFGKKAANSTHKNEDNVVLNSKDLLNKICLILINRVSELLKISEKEMDIDNEFSEYGFDSIMFTRFSNELNNEFGLELTPSIFFERPTIRSFAEFLISEHKEIFAEKKEVVNPEEINIRKENEQEREDVSVKHLRISGRRGRERNREELIVRKDKKDGIAVIGMSGVFPGAKDIEEYWINLREGKNSIVEIPEDRWDWNKYYGDSQKEGNKTNIRWGGCIDGLYEFDPLFFGISPREAEVMDPQQRLLMTYVWKVIEDAGYAAENLSGSRTGIYIGTGSSGYINKIYQNNVDIEGFSSTSIVPSMGPNRMSYYLNFHGPSEPIETACSSSLVAIHRAVQAIEDGSCDMAIVGGVNTMLDPVLHISFDKVGVLSADGRCKTFSEKADGLVRGEGAGMLFLKRLEEAERDRDHIYGVIAGTAENHGGKAASLTSPNPNSQAEVIMRAYEKAGIEPETVTYIEAHGTGTPLGDPIEINGLKIAFEEMYRKKGKERKEKEYCGIGAVKSNIGHLELASGVAGVIKVLLQMKYKTLVKSLNSEPLNPYIQLKGSPFYIVKEKREWKALKNDRGGDILRRAGVSSFGFGGVNAHIVIEEYKGKAEAEGRGENEERPVMIVLSARDEVRLKEKAEDLIKWLEKEDNREVGLENIAYTLQVGRDGMEERLGFIAGNKKELKEKLSKYISGEKEPEGMFRGQFKKNNDNLFENFDDDKFKKQILEWFNQGRYETIIKEWIQGRPVQWMNFYQDMKPQRLSLPSYSFAKDRYCIGLEQNTESIPSIKTDKPQINNHEVEIVSSQEESITIRDDLLYLPVWEEINLPHNHSESFETVLMVYFGSSRDFADVIIADYKKKTERIIQIKIGAVTRHIAEDEWECGENDSAGFEACLKQYDEINGIFFIGELQSGLSSLLIDKIAEIQEKCGIQLLRLAKYIQVQAGNINHTDWYVITQDNYRVSDNHINPYGGCITGLGYSMAQGNSKMALRNIDISFEDLASEEKKLNLSHLIQSLEPSSRGDIIKIWDGRVYQQAFQKLEGADCYQSGGIKKRGVYVIIGGSGRVGGVMTRLLIQDFKAKIIWIGRKDIHSQEISEKLAELKELGQQPFYVQADVNNQEDLRKALAAIKEKYAVINGVLFCGLIFKMENSISQTSEQDFIDIVGIKTKGIWNTFQVFENEPMDFMAFFSSAQAFSFSGASSFSAYAAAMTASDSLVHLMKSSAGFPIGMINWGFWKTTLEEAAKLLNSGFLEDEEGFYYFKNFVGLLKNHVLRQVVCLKTNDSVRKYMRLKEDAVTIYENKTVSLIGTQMDNYIAEEFALYEDTI